MNTTPTNARRSLRQSMSWLHTWSGLLLGWLMFAIFLTGTLSFYRQEITLWMQPETHQARAEPIAFDKALAYLQQHAPEASQWNLTLPGARTPLLGLSWQEKPPARSSAPGRDAPRSETGSAARETGRAHSRGGRPGGEARSARQHGGAGETDARPQAAEPAPAQGHRPAMRRVVMDPASGTLLAPRETAGGNFLYRFHFELFGLDRTLARWIVGIATMCMLAALVTGVIIHRQIFRDFFTFRPGKGKRSWLDAHNATGILALPFHLVITFSGLLLIGPMLMPSAIATAYGGDLRGMMQERRSRAMQPVVPPAGVPTPLAPLEPLLAQAARQWPEQGVGSIVISNPGDANARIEMRQARGERLSNRAQPERMLFDGVSGAALEAPPPPTPTSFTTGIWQAFSALHLGQFAAPAARLLLFASGLAGCLMIATGLVMWVVSRQKAHAAGNKPHFGVRLVQGLNLATLAGMPLAIGAHFWANRLLPAQLAGRETREIQIFFIAWALTALHAWLRPHKQAWIEQLATAGLLIASLPVLNAATGGASLVRSMASGIWPVAGFDLLSLLLGVSLLLAAHRIAHHHPAVARAKHSQ